MTWCLSQPAGIASRGPWSGWPRLARFSGSARGSREPVTVNFFDLVYGGASSATIRHFAYTGFPETYGADLAVLVRLVADGRLHPEIGRVADWPETASVIADLRERRIRGNAVLTLRGQCPAFRRTVNVGVKPLEAG